MIERALLFTDVVDSTQMTERLGDARTAELWTKHDRGARDLLALHHGLEIGRGDGFLLLFEAASDALCYALDYQSLMSELGLRARCGLHYGRVLLRENSADEIVHGVRRIDVQGLAVSVAARVMALASGSRTLLSATARMALGDALPEESEIRSHGFYRMKGVEAPLEILEVGRRGSVQFEPPADTDKAYRVSRVKDLWLPVREVHHNLPAERDAFVGRAAELGELQRLFSGGARLVSIAGIGGTGKTRLARRYGWTALGEFSGGVWFCDLSQARTLDGVAFAVARSLDVPLADGDPVEQLALALRARGRCLLILDNFEPVVEHAEATVGLWLDRVVEASYLATTREVLRVAGEVVLQLQPLAPTDGAALFVTRAAAAKGESVPAEQDAAVLKLVEVLDGLPLAIELAAARARIMSAGAMVERMHERFKLLSSQAQGRGRQATLRATFDWSWDLLNASERSALAELSVFEGGFTLEAAQAVIDASRGQTDTGTLDLIQSLVDKSLLRRASERRFDMLASLQDYADEHLRTPGRIDGSGAAALAAAQARHWRYFAALAEAQVIADRCADADNLVVACRRAAARQDASGAAGALLGAWAVLALRGPYRATVELADTVLQIPGIGPADRSRAELVKGSALFMLGRADDARACVDAGLTQVEVPADTETEARLLCVRGELLTKAGRHTEASADLQHALTLARNSGPEALQCKVLNALIVLAVERGDLPEARNYCEAGLRIARAARDERWEGGILGNAAFIDYCEGKIDSAVERYLQALELARQTGDLRWEGNARCNVGLLLHEQKQPAKARDQLEAALDIARSIGHARLEGMVLCNLGIVLEALGSPGAACEYYEESVRLAQGLRDTRTEGQFRAHLGTCYARQGDFGKARSCLAAGESLLGAIGDRLNFALLLCAASEVEHLAGDRERARAQLARAEALASAAGAGADSELGQRLLTVRGLLGESDRSPVAPATD